MTDRELADVFIQHILGDSANVDPHYFQVPVSGSDELFLRERVYCYELYHQLRVGLGDKFPCKLMGELDKAKHPVIMKIAGAKEPDFVWHVPGTERNIVIAEVKALARFPNGVVNAARIADDTGKLLPFLGSDIHYKLAVQLLYGPGDYAELQAVHKKIVGVAGKLADRFVVIWHSGPRSKAQIIG